MNERRPLTILFSDLLQSTALSASTDDEDYLHAIMRYWEIADEVIAEHGGYLAQREGDGVYAWFGYPTATELDARHAIQAGLELTRRVRDLNDELGAAIGSKLSARVGIHTGTVVIAETSDGRPFGFGFAVNFAAKVQAAAALDTVMVSEATLAVLRDPVATGTTVALPVDGLVGTIAAHEVTDTAAPSIGAALIGRLDELATLNRQWDEVCEGSGRVAVLRGAPGLGKTRLAREASAQTHSVGQTIWSRCERSRARSALWPFAELLRSQLGLASHERLDGSAIDVLASNLGIAERAPLLRIAVGIEPATAVELDPLTLHRETLGAVRALAAAVAKARPTVLVVDDAHWADPSTAELISGLADNPVPGLHVILTAWPEFDTAPLRSAQVIDLQPLTADEAAAMAASLDTWSLMPDRVQQIIDDAGGSPLVIEALVRHGELAVGSGVRQALIPRSQVPTMLHAPILARIESIDGATTLTRFASAAGLQFDLDLVSAAVGIDVGTAGVVAKALSTVDLLRPTDRPDRWEFQHSLVRDLAYDAFLTDERHDAHSRIADALRTRGEPDLALLAFHFERANRISDAIDAGIEVGAAARTTGSYAEAEDVLTRTIELLHDHDRIDDATTKLLSAHRHRSFLRVARADNAYAAGEEDSRAILGLLDASPPSYELAAALAAEWGNAMQQGDMDKARACIVRHDAIAHVDLPDIRPLADAGAGVLASWEGRLEEAITLLDRSGEELRGVGWVPPLSTAWATPDHPAASVEAHRAAVLVHLGDVEAALAAIDTSIAIASSLPWPIGPFSEAYVRTYAASCATTLGDSARVIEHAGRVQELANTHGMDFWARASLVYFAIGGAMAAPSTDLIDVLTMTSQVLAATGTASVLYHAVLMEAARAAIRCDAPERASSLMVEAIEHAERSTITCFLPEMRRLLARVSPSDRAISERQQGSKTAQDQGAVLYELRLALDTADPEIGSGDQGPLEAVRLRAPATLEAHELARRQLSV